MIFEKSITVPANTAKNARQRNFLKVAAGVIHLVEIQFPPGCRNLTHVTINQGGHPLVPSTWGQTIAADNHTVSLKEYIPIDSGSTRLSLLTYNEDDTYEHTIRVRIGVLKAEVLNPWELLEALIRGFRRSSQSNRARL